MEEVIKKVQSSNDRIEELADKVKALDDKVEKIMTSDHNGDSENSGDNGKKKKENKIISGSSGECVLFTSFYRT